ncbi:hypothetical protein BRADI_4g33284v3 [Brachypodium distachyon]|uniref:Uncharacterized protein n=1 Tax=Brachypodium distachyon TaxID=15368 RepID=A0A0Q3LDP5_BRADI|nr:hypothetical protein BRADI_4g33284v3 [Brachypodium distachyon]
MARGLLASATSGTAAGILVPPSFAALCMVVASVWVVSLAVFLCGRSSRGHADDDVPAGKKPAAAPADTTMLYAAAFIGGAVGGGGCGGGGGGCSGGCGGC